MKKLVIFGTSSLARQVYAYLSHDSPYKIVAFTVHEKYLDEKKLFGLPVVPFERIVELHPPDQFAMIVAIGYTRVNKARAEVYNECKAKGYDLISYINSKFGYCGHVDIGDNTFVYGNGSIGPFAKIGNNCFIGPSIVAHNSIIGDHCWLSGGVMVSGDVKIGDYCFVGANATIRDGITVAPECIIGAGVVILNDTKKGAVYLVRNAKIAPFKSHDRALRILWQKHPKSSI